MSKFRNLPNILSAMRIAIIPFFAVTYLNYEGAGPYFTPAAILVLSGITDFLDGYIARKYHFETYLGKILDPMADKLTQFVTCLVIGFKVPIFFALAGLYFVKEILMLIGGIWLTKKKIKIAGSKWWGKVATGAFYVVTVGVILFPNAPSEVNTYLCAALMGIISFAFIMYIPEFLKLLKPNELFDDKE